MSEESKSFEKKLDRDFLEYLNLTKPLFNNLKEGPDREWAEVWLAHLFGKSFNSIPEKCDRNVYISRLLIQMQNGKLNGVFLESPPNGPLPCAFSTFGLPTEIDDLKGFEEMGFQIESGSGSGDFFETSRDGRTYLATRHLPQGIMAYMAVTNNEGQPAWLPQICPSSLSESPCSSEFSDKLPKGFVKKLLEFTDMPLCRLRRSPEEREQIMEWMDRIIDDCNKWIRGEDPHNMELEHLFETLYEEYKCDPENCEILKHPKSLRAIICRDIRDKVAAKRAQASKREMILDQYESEQYTEEQDEDYKLDEVWLEYANKPINSSTKFALESFYPSDVVDRFTQLLIQERLFIIQKGERQVKKKIAELRKASVEDTKRELQILKRIQDEYREYYNIYQEIEERIMEFEKQNKESCKKNKSFSRNNLEKFKQDTESEIQEAKKMFDMEMKTQYELREKLEEAKDNLRRAKEKAAVDADILNCRSNQIRMQMQELQEQICYLRKRKEELQCKLNRSS